MVNSKCFILIERNSGGIGSFDSQLLLVVGCCCCRIFLFSFCLFSLLFRLYFGPRFHHRTFVILYPNQYRLRFQRKSFSVFFFFFFSFFFHINKRDSWILNVGNSLAAWLFVRIYIYVADGTHTKYIPSNRWIMMIINKIWRGIFHWWWRKIWLIVCLF